MGTGGEFRPSATAEVGLLVLLVVWIGTAVLLQFWSGILVGWSSFIGYGMIVLVVLAGGVFSTWIINGDVRLRQWWLSWLALSSINLVLVPVYLLLTPRLGPLPTIGIMYGIGWPLFYVITGSKLGSDDLGWVYHRFRSVSDRIWDLLLCVTAGVIGGLLVSLGVGLLTQQIIAEIAALIAVEAIISPIFTLRRPDYESEILEEISIEESVPKKALLEQHILEETKSR